MNVISTSENGIVNSETIFHFSQTNMNVQAQYSGGRIRNGYLVGQLNNGILRFSYCQLRITGELDHGASECILLKDKDSDKIRLEEHFNMNTEASNEVGVNIFMEL